MGTQLLGYQATLCEKAVLSGVTVHSGEQVSISLLPAAPNTGVKFRRIFEDGTTSEVMAVAGQVGATDLCTMIGDPAGVHIATIEHLMAAIWATGLDNVIIELDGNEVPVMDGSSRVFIDAIDEAGIVHHAVKRRYVRVKKTVRVEIGGSWAEFRPYSGTRFEVVIDFDSPLIGRQEFKSDVDEDVFREELADARTFGFMKDVERLWASGHALGSSLENSVVISDDHTIINPEGLRYRDEFVRHKTLDAVGDLALAGAQFIGCYASYRGGHRLNAAALKALLTDRTAYEIVETPEKRERVFSGDFVTVAAAPAYAPWML
ncbi:UDP-3-O-acyl-N-acetylglucosamine deacetylase [Oricola thermophila]|uniref:UDP-3-O-acyl-N-acetylglucosamine deacetylase n=1 Tax=Oricola thermophila TaxID=2742145 RepID=A0A6N1V8C0_9HYPH|nr:UDP-3-O-acyl-N-acetylglucosamine deacetylase [Oricola thermophila]QKV17211.1 UDP-3-O-acyl-N-acetylglucosamine deacetylase [Oricola thermophila]